MNVELFTAALETDGHDVVIERDGRSGLERALGERFDLVILDVQLPGMDGFAVVRELRAANVRGPIVAVSSSAMAWESFPWASRRRIPSSRSVSDSPVPSAAACVRATCSSLR